MVTEPLLPPAAQPASAPSAPTAEPSSTSLAATVESARVQLLRAGLGHAAEALRKLPPRWRPLQTACERDLAAAREELDRALGHLEAAARSQALTLAADRIAEIVEDCLELATGHRARVGRDEAACDMAELLVAELAAGLPLPQWPRACLPGPVDSYSRRTRVLHLGATSRTPGHEVWSLPAIVHELGHQIAPLVVMDAGSTTVQQVNAVVRKAGREDATRGRHLSELFADCFAAWTLGPAYGLWMTWAGPGLTLTGAEGSDSHPAVGVRVAQVVRTLVDLGCDQAAAAVAEVARATGVGAPAQPDPALDNGCEELRGLLRRRLDGRYRTFDLALGLAPVLARPAGAPGVVGRARYTAADVLNAAWWARAHDPEAARRISERAWLLLQVAAPAIGQGRIG